MYILFVESILFAIHKSISFYKFNKDLIKTTIACVVGHKIGIFLVRKNEIYATLRIIQISKLNF